jgi:hypothetical protein
MTTDELTQYEPQPKKKKETKPSKHNPDLGDAYKFGVFALRTLVAAVTGKVFGDSSVDSALGTAIASIQDPFDIAEQGTAYSVLMNGAAGAWKAVEGDE